MGEQTCSIVNQQVAGDIVFDDVMWGGYLGACVLPRCHTNFEHVIQVPDGRYFAWKDDYDCGCCEPDEIDRCTIFWEITEEEFFRLVSQVHPDQLSFRLV